MFLLDTSNTIAYHEIGHKRTQRAIFHVGATGLRALWACPERLPAKPDRGEPMTQAHEETVEPFEPVGHVRIVYLGPVAPHWEIQSDWGDEETIQSFADRANARLVLLPPHDPQFRRNRERVARDAEREHLELEWDLGFDEDTPADR
jgi:hypothetical protein